MAALHTKLSRTAKSIRSWARTLQPHGKLVMAICREVILQLELAQEQRQLSASEHNLIKHLKSRILGLAAVEKSRAR
jgi:hypothetical protein